MKTIYLLFVILTDFQGYESLQAVSNVEHSSVVACNVEKAQYKDSENMKFFCADSNLFSKRNIQD